MDGGLGIVSLQFACGPSRNSPNLMPISGNESKVQASSDPPASPPKPRIPGTSTQLLVIHGKVVAGEQGPRALNPSV